jgi:serine/threonine protein phosphatase PrpC
MDVLITVATSIPVERSINLGGSMGDLLFKLKKDSPVLLNTPDVTFHEVPRDLKVILLMSSDGLW